MNIFNVAIDDLRPTQSCVGFLEVDAKAKKIEKMSHEERQTFLKENPVPVVNGFHNHFYIIDHHHMARAVLQAGHQHVHIKVLEDLSHLDKNDFWKCLHKKGYIYLKNAKGEDISPEDIPKRVSAMKDDPYRSLAGFVRKAGGFDKNQTPFSEFRWAEFFRNKIKFENTRKGLEKVLPQAIELAKSPEAHHLIQTLI
jgi:hypothetical protein